MTVDDEDNLTVRRGNRPEDRDGLLLAIAMTEANQRGDAFAMDVLAPGLDDETIGLVNGFLALLDSFAAADPEGFAVVLDAVRQANVD